MSKLPDEADRLRLSIAETENLISIQREILEQRTVLKLSQGDAQACLDMLEQTLAHLQTRLSAIKPLDP